jgi:hypothetical protein
MRFYENDDCSVVLSSSHAAARQTPREVDQRIFRMQLEYRRRHRPLHAPACQVSLPRLAAALARRRLPLVTRLRGCGHARCNAHSTRIVCPQFCFTESLWRVSGKPRASLAVPRAACGLRTHAAPVACENARRMTESKRKGAWANDHPSSARALSCGCRHPL